MLKSLANTGSQNYATQHGVDGRHDSALFGILERLKVQHSTLQNLLADMENTINRALGPIPDEMAKGQMVDPSGGGAIGQIRCEISNTDDCLAALSGLIARLKTIA